MTVATYSQVAAAVSALLFVVDLFAMMIYVSRSGKIDPEEGHVVTENRSLTANDSVAMGGSGVAGGRYWGKHKVFLSRSTYISDMSLVDGTATQAQRRLVRGIKLAAILFWLAWVFLGLSLLPSQPIFGTMIIIFLTYAFIQSVRMVRKGRADAMRKLKERQESREARRHKP
ncbi:MAG: hypothetical protein ACLQO1_13380 [Steroidobacteraceae bacterium]